MLVPSVSVVASGSSSLDDEDMTVELERCLQPVVSFRVYLDADDMCDQFR